MTELSEPLRSIFLKIVTAIACLNAEGIILSRLDEGTDELALSFYPGGSASVYFSANNGKIDVALTENDIQKLEPYFEKGASTETSRKYALNKNGYDLYDKMVMDKIREFVTAEKEKNKWHEVFVGPNNILPTDIFSRPTPTTYNLLLRVLDRYIKRLRGSIKVKGEMQGGWWLDINDRSNDSAFNDQNNVVGTQNNVAGNQYNINVDGIILNDPPSLIQSPSIASDADSEEKAEIAIITALDDELDAVLSHIGDYETFQEGNFTYYRGHIANINRVVEVVVNLLPGMGNDTAATTVPYLLQRWHPTYILMVGIGGGRKEKVALGDVVVADFCYYYELAKETPEGQQIRPQQFPSDPLLYDRARAYRKGDWVSQIGVEMPLAKNAKPRTSNIHYGTIASGDKVIAYEEKMKELLQGHPNLIAVAMEGVGVARAAHYNLERPRFLEIRGVSDFADRYKRDKWRKFAANAAAAFAIGMLRTQTF